MNISPPPLSLSLSLFYVCVISLSVVLKFKRTCFVYLNVLLLDFTCQNNCSSLPNLGTQQKQNKWLLLLFYGCPSLFYGCLYLFTLFFLHFVFNCFYLSIYPFFSCAFSNCFSAFLSFFLSFSSLRAKVSTNPFPFLSIFE